METRKEDDLFAAIDEQDTDLIESLIEGGADLSVTNHDDHTPIEYAACREYWNCVDTITDFKTDTNDTYHFGAALVYVVRANFLTRASFLLEAGAGIDWGIDEDNDSVLHFAVKNKNVEMIKLLISYGANINVLNDDDQTPLQLAFNQRFWEGIEAFIHHIKTQQNEDVEDDSSKLVEINASWDSPELKLKGVTIPWLLAYYEKWDYLREFGELYDLDLSKKPEWSSHDSDYIENTAWLLARHNRFELLFHFMIKARDNYEHFKSVLLSEDRLGSLFVEHWMGKSDWPAIEKPSLIQLLRQTKHEFIVNIRLIIPSTSLFFNLTTLSIAKHIQEQVSPLIERYQELNDSEKNDVRALLHRLFSLLLSISVTSMDYKTAQGEITQIIGNHILPCQPLHRWTIDFLQYRLSLMTTFYDHSMPPADEHRLRLIMMQCAVRSNDPWYITNSYAESLRRSITLHSENETLRRENEKLRHDLKTSREKSKHEMKPQDTVLASTTEISSGPGLFK
jgi:hypothetical protein